MYTVRALTPPFLPPGWHPRCRPHRRHTAVVTVAGHVYPGCGWECQSWRDISYLQYLCGQWTKHL